MKLRSCLAVLLFGCLCALAARGQIVVTGYTETGNLPANDDHYSEAIDLGFTIHFGGEVYSQTYVSNNGYITFDYGSYYWTPESLDANYSGQPIIAAFFSDVDTRGPNSGIVSWGTGLVDNNAAFVVKWDHVGEYHYEDNPDLLNTFSMVLVSRSDVQTGSFDVYFDYDTITWDHGGNVVVGFHDGNTTNPQFYSVPGSFQADAFLDNGTYALNGLSNTGTAGFLTFVSRDGVFENVAEITPIPEPSTIALLALGLGVVGFTVARRRKS